MSRDAKVIFEEGGCSVLREYSGQYRLYMRVEDSLKMVTLPKGVPAEAFLTIGADMKPVPKRKYRKKKAVVDVPPEEVAE